LEIKQEYSDHDRKWLWKEAYVQIVLGNAATASTLESLVRQSVTDLDDKHGNGLASGIRNLWQEHCRKTDVPFLWDTKLFHLNTDSKAASSLTEIDLEAARRVSRPKSLEQS
jgi:hypothetical protein